MADKEAAVYIVDVGRHTRDVRGERKQSDLDWAMTYVWDKLLNTVATERKTLTLGVVGLGTDGTSNELQSQEGFQNISVLKPIGQLLLPELRELKAQIRSSGSHQGDAISAIVLAITMISAYTRKLKYKRRIILVTNGRGIVDPDGIDAIAQKIKDDGIDLLVIGVDFDDPEYGFQEKNKDVSKMEHENLLYDLTRKSDGLFGTMAEAIEELATPRLKVVRPIPSFKGDLTLGDSATYDNALCINVERYARIMIRRPQAARQIWRSTLHGTSSDQASTWTPPEIQPPKLLYQVDDQNVDGGKREVSRENLTKGFEYGRTIVPISESDFDITKLETVAGLQILGFIPNSAYDRFMSMSVSHVIIGQKANRKAIIALSSLIHALFELDTYAIGRFVTKADHDPVLCVLAPSIEADFECLLQLELPFAEDARSYKFPPLDRVITVSGKKIQEHRNLPTQDLITAMSDYVDEMDIDQNSQHLGDTFNETWSFENSYSATLHRVAQVVQWRALQSDETIPPASEKITRYSHPSVPLIERSQHHLDSLIKIADVKQIPAQKLSRKRAREEIKPLSGLDIGAILRKPENTKKSRLTAENAIPDFCRSIDESKSVQDMHDGANQLAAIIEAQIRDSFADKGYEGAIEKLVALRKELLDVEEPDHFNSLLRAIVKKVKSEELNGNRIEFWNMLQRRQLGLISNETSQRSSTSEEEAQTFLAEA